MPPQAPSCRGVFLARTLSNTRICPEHYRLVLAVKDFPQALPGQFLQILCSEPDTPDAQSPRAGSTFIRRPFSIGGLRRDADRCELDIYHRVVGPGTRWLEKLRPGDPVDILGPLGKPFPIASDRPVALLVGGGIGLPPLIWLAQALKAAGKRTVAFIGARSAHLIPLTRVPDVPVISLEPTAAFAEFAQFETPAVLATNDGSLGSAGYVPDALAGYVKMHPELDSTATVFTCGPDPMMRAVVPLCEQRGMPCCVCLERTMACGMGTCQSCVVRVKDPAAADGWRYRLCCTDGPVFDSRLIFWDEQH